MDTTVSSCITLDPITWIMFAILQTGSLCSMARNRDFISTIAGFDDDRRYLSLVGVALGSPSEYHCDDHGDLAALLGVERSVSTVLACF